MSTRISQDQLLLQEPRDTVDRVTRFLKTQKEKTGASCLIVGMSGGLDSSVTAALCALAVGGRNVLGVTMPEKETWSAKNVRDAEEIAKKFRLQFKTVDITPMVSTMIGSLPSVVRRKGSVPYANIKARLRAVVLYFFANRENGLVVGTGDKSEVNLGYFTKFGDGACDLQPLGDMYKTTVRHLAKHLGIPRRIYMKNPSPELWPGQSAEKELGLSYEKLDLILWGLERWISPEDIAEDIGLSVSTVERVRERWLRSEHKRRPPLVLKLGYRTAGADLRLPYSMT